MNVNELVRCVECDREVELTGDGKLWRRPKDVEATVALCSECVGRLALVGEPVGTTGMIRVEHKGWKYVRPADCPVFFRMKAATAAPSPKLARAKGDPHKLILIVEDDTEVMETVGDALEGKDYRVAGAMTGQEGIDMISHRRYDLVLLDIGLPEANGLMVLDHLRAQDGKFGSITPVIIMTGEPEAEKRQLAESLQISAFLSKPFSLVRLLEHVQKVLPDAS